MRGWSNLARFRSCFVWIRRNLGDDGQIWPVAKFGQGSTKIRRFRSNSGEFGHVLASFGRNWTSLGRFRCILPGFSLHLARFRCILPVVLCNGRMWLDLGCCLARDRPNLGTFGRLCAIWAKFTPMTAAFWPKLARVRQFRFVFNLIWEES